MQWGDKGDTRPLAGKATRRVNEPQNFLEDLLPQHRPSFPLGKKEKKQSSSESSSLLEGKALFSLQKQPS